MGDNLLKNRVIMASLTRNRDNVPRESLHVPYYSERAGTGLIVSSSLMSFRCLSLPHLFSNYSEPLFSND